MEQMEQIEQNNIINDLAWNNTWNIMQLNRTKQQYPLTTAT